MCGIEWELVMKQLKNYYFYQFVKTGIHNPPLVLDELRWSSLRSGTRFRWNDNSEIMSFFQNFLLKIDFRGRLSLPLL